MPLIVLSNIGVCPWGDVIVGAALIVLVVPVVIPVVNHHGEFEPLGGNGSFPPAFTGLIHLFAKIIGPGPSGF